MQHDKQDHAAAARFVLRALLNSHRLYHFGHILKNAVNLGGTDTNATHIQNAIRPAVQARSPLGVNSIRSPWVQTPGFWLK